MLFKFDDGISSKISPFGRFFIAVSYLSIIRNCYFELISINCAAIEDKESNFVTRL